MTNEGEIYFGQLVDIIKQGYVKIKSKKLGIWKSYFVILRRPSSKGPLRLEKFSSEKASEKDSDTSPNYESLQYISSVSLHNSESRKYSIVVWCSACGNVDSSSLNIISDSEYEIQDWYETLKNACEFYGRQRDEFAEANVFHVYLLPTPCLNFYGEFLLELTPTNIIILNPGHQMEGSSVSPSAGCKPMISWPINALRRFGGDKVKFTLESGRSCKTGEGLFIFSSHQSELIHDQVRRTSHALAEAVRSSGASLRRTASEHGRPSQGSAPQLPPRGHSVRSRVQGSRPDEYSQLTSDRNSIDHRPLPPVPPGKT